VGNVAEPAVCNACSEKAADIPGATGRHVPQESPEPQATTTIGKSADELYRLWREPRTLSRIVGHLAEVAAAPDGRARWSAPARPGIAWSGRPGSSRSAPAGAASAAGRAH
jgi:uncharacterized membrane protein